MNDFPFARSLMAMSLAFHIVFAALGIGMPLLMVLAEGAYLRTRQLAYLEISKRWAKGTAIVFDVGAVPAPCFPSSSNFMAMGAPSSGCCSRSDASRFCRRPAATSQLAAMEAHYRTEAGAPLVLGGLPDDATRTPNSRLRADLEVCGHASEVKEVLTAIIAAQPDIAALATESAKSVISVSCAA